MTLPLSVVVLTLNEAPRMKRCLESLAPAAQVVVMDSYSEDNTLESARQVWQSLNRGLHDISLVSTQWKGFTKTRNDSLEWVREPWVLWIDADEWVEPALWKDIETLIKSSPESDVWMLPRLSFFLGRAIWHGGWYPDRKARLAKSSACVWKSGPNNSDVHEDLYPKTLSKREFLKTKHHIFHEGFRSTHEQFETNDRYSTLLAKGLAESWMEKRKAAPSKIYIAFKVALKFVENYIWKLGILDAYPGFLIAKGSAISMKMRLDKAKKILLERKSA